MPWVRLDDKMLRHPKIIAAGRDARDLYLAAIFYCNEQLTDGFVAEAALRRLAADAEVDEPRALCQRLIECGLFEQSAGGWRVHDYLVYQSSRAKVLAGRADPDHVSNVRRESGRLGGLAKASKQRANLLESSRAIAEQTPGNASSPNPNPNPNPNPIPNIDKSGESARALVPASSAWHPKDFREAVASFCDEYPESPEYPKLGDRGAVASALAAACPSPEDFARVMAGLAAWKRSARWLDTYPRFAPKATKFLGERMFLHPPQDEQPATNGARAPLALVGEDRGPKRKSLKFS